MSFRLKTVLGIALIEAALLLILVLSSLWELRHIGEQQLKQRAQTTATLFATTTADAVLSSDLAALESFVEEVLGNPGLVYARVLSNDQVLAEDGIEEGALLREFHPDTDLEEVEDGTYDTYAEITIGGETYGRVEIGLEIGHLRTEFSRALANFSGIAIAELILSAVFSLVLGTLLTRQLRLLIKGTRAVADGNFGYQLKTRGRDEIAQAAQAFNSMSSGLAELMEQNAAQQADLQQTTDLLSGLVDNLQSGILMIDMDRHINHVNSGFTEMFAIAGAPDQLIGQSMQELAELIKTQCKEAGSDNDCGVVLQVFDELKQNQQFNLSDGRVIEADYIPLFTGQRQYAHLWNYRDVTERVRAQQQEEERRRQLDTVFELSPDGFVYFDQERKVTWVNRAFTGMTGISVETARGTHRNQFFSLLRSHCGVTDVDDSGGRRILRTTLPVPRVLASEERILNPEEGISALVMYVRDVTSETELDEMKSAFLTTAEHELRTPLIHIQDFSETLLQTAPDTNAARDMIESIHRQSLHLMHMLNELADLERIEARADRDFNIQQQPLLPVLHDFIEAYQPPNPDRVIEVDLPPTLPAVPLDPGKFQLLLENVLNNAFHYSPDGGDVCLQAIQGEQTVQLSVVDHGMGMTTAQKASVFERFYRADKSGAVPGSGLGMSLVREIVNIHGWDIRVDSTPGEGTRVDLVIPLRSTLPQPRAVAGLD